MLESLNENINLNHPCYAERAIKPTYTWEEVVAFLQYCADEDQGQPIGILNYKLPDADKVQGIQLVKEYLNENLDNKIVNTQMCITLSVRDNPTYKNDCGMILWNTQGLSEFSFTDEEGEVKRLMQPGDLVFVPAELPFKMTALNARAFVSFGLENKEQDGN
jgi:hypothetical protein